MAKKFNALAKEYHAAWAGIDAVDPALGHAADAQIEALAQRRDDAFGRLSERRAKSIRQIAAKVMIAQNEMKRMNPEVAERMIDSAVADLAQASI